MDPSLLRHGDLDGLLLRELQPLQHGVADVLGARLVGLHVALPAARPAHEAQIRLVQLRHLPPLLRREVLLARGQRRLRLGLRVQLVDLLLGKGKAICEWP